MKTILLTTFVLVFVVSFLLSVDYKTIAQNQTMTGMVACTPEREGCPEAFPFYQNDKYNVVEGGTPCMATYYGDYYHGRLTANGEVFDQEGMTAASNIYPIGTRIRMQYGDKSVEVRINDTGAFTHTVDLSKGAFRVLAPLEQGVINGRCTVL